MPEGDMLLRILGAIAIVAFIMLLWLLFGRTQPCRRCHHPIPRSEGRCPNCGWTPVRRER